MKKIYIIMALFVIFTACNKSEDYGVSAYENKDYLTAFILAEKGCNDKNGEACYILANIYNSGLSRQADQVKAARYYIKACDIGNGRACYMVGKIYSQSRVVPEDIDQSESYFRKSNQILVKECSSGNAESCLYAGALYLYSQGVPHDSEKAIEYFEKSCRLNHGPACYTIGMLYKTGKYGIAQDMNKANSFLNKACNIGYEDACKEK